MANDDLHKHLSRRERQIMGVIYERGRATAAEVREHLPGSPSNSTVRTLLRLLEEKGHLKHVEERLRYVYLPIVARDKVKKSALKQVMQTFFNNSAEETVAALLDVSRSKLTDQDLKRISQLIAQARKEGR